MSSAWQMIALAGAASYALRATPLLMFRKLSLHPEGWLARFLGHAAAAVMGSIIYTALFGDQCLVDLSTHLRDPTAVLKLAAVCVAALLALCLRGVMVPLIAATALFAAASFFVGVPHVAFE